jgi:D-alanine-D-alanine ligase
MGKILVGIAMGGYASEKGISLESGNNVYQNLSREKWEVFRLLINKNQWIVLDQNNHEIEFDQNNYSFNFNGETLRFDVIFNAVHGLPGENGELAAALKSQNIPQTSCDSLAASLTFDKRKCLEIAKKTGVSTAKSIAFNHGDRLDEDVILKIVGLPCFVKPNRSGSSYGIVKAQNKKDIGGAVELALKEDSELIIESALEGPEISVGVYIKNNKIIVLPATEVISENDFFDYQAKYEGESEEITPAKLDAEVVEKVNEIVEKLYSVFELKGVCRSEFILVDGDPHLLEINTVPGLTPASLIPQQLEAAGIALTDFFDQLLEQALKKNN